VLNKGELDGIPTTFSKKDAKACFSCSKKPPEYRVVWVDWNLDEYRELRPGTGVSLLCRNCLGHELNQWHATLEHSDDPVGDGESSHNHGVRPIALLVTPLTLTGEQADLLATELQTHGIEETRN
jgi:hypothetical protein